MCPAEQWDSGAVRPSGRLQETTCQPGSPSSRTLGGTRQHSGDAHDTCFLAQRMAWNPQQEGGWQLTGSSLESRGAMVVAKGAQSSRSARVPAHVAPQLATLLALAVGLFQDAMAFG